MKKLLRMKRDFPPHWVGDGFPVRTLFSYRGDPSATDPFLLLDYAGLHEFPPGRERRGVGEHPHRGFETVTIVYQGELEHRDSAGNHGVIGPGDVQWMTAAAGVIHEEFHSVAFTERGGTFEVVQLWVNLPAREKLSPPRYQEIRDRDIPRVVLGDGAGSARIIAGELLGMRGPAKTVTAMNVWDLQLGAGGEVELPLPDGHTAMLVVARGSVKFDDDQEAAGLALVHFEREGAAIRFDAVDEMRALLLSGAPIDEPIVGHGPFVMNTREEIQQAMIDYRSGRMGSLAIH